MGIKGLLTMLAGAVQPVTLADLCNQRVAIDMYCWLHRACYGCSAELVKGLPTDKYVRYVVRRLDVMLSHRITPVLVFDGAPLPMKRGTELQRRA